MTDDEMTAKLEAFARDFDNVPALAAMFGEAAARIRELSATVAALLPSNLNIIGSTVDDDAIIPVDFTMGELRAARATLAKGSSDAD